MNAAIYARKSTDQFGLTDEARSVTRQIEHARAEVEPDSMSLGDPEVTPESPLRRF